MKKTLQRSIRDYLWTNNIPLEQYANDIGFSKQILNNYLYKGVELPAFDYEELKRLHGRYVDLKQPDEFVDNSSVDELIEKIWG